MSTESNVIQFKTVIRKKRTIQPAQDARAEALARKIAKEQADHKELDVDPFVSFSMDANDPACFIVDELPTDTCPGCGELHEGEEHTDPAKLH